MTANTTKKIYKTHATCYEPKLPPDLLFRYWHFVHMVVTCVEEKRREEKRREEERKNQLHQACRAPPATCVAQTDYAAPARDTARARHVPAGVSLHGWEELKHDTGLGNIHPAKSSFLLERRTLTSLNSGVASKRSHPVALCAEAPNETGSSVTASICVLLRLPGRSATPMGGRKLLSSRPSCVGRKVSRDFRRHGAVHVAPHRRRLGEG